ncbi:MAG: hypothetical protein K0R78_2980 [Pelosinus sp.]|jgi:hypothetical protein|nr:hypothetical protein [Pelosinus sp.]
MDGSELVSQEQRNKVAQYYKDNLLVTAQFFTGLASSKRTEIFKSVGHVVQGMFSDKFLGNLQKEVNNYILAGKIKEDYIISEQNLMCFIELLRNLEENLPDPNRLELLRKIYIVTATEDINDRDSPLPLQFMQMARELTSGEVLVLFAMYRLEGTSVNSQAGFIKQLIEESGLEYTEIVTRIHQSLFNKGFVKSVNDGLATHSILIRDLFTPLGRAFCDYVMHYNDLSQL